MKKLGINFENVLAISKELNLSVLETLNKLKELGFTSLDVKYERIIDKEQYLKDIVLSGFLIESIFSLCPLNEQNNYQKAIEIVDTATEYKVKEIMLIPSFIEGGYSETDYANLKQNLRRVVKYAEPLGISVGIENVGNKNASCITPAQTLDVLRSVKGLHLIYDGGNFVLAEENPKELIYEIAPFVQRYHLKDRVISDALEGFLDTTISGKKSQVAELGKGDSFVKEIYEILSGVYRDIPLVLEFTFGDNKIFDRVKNSAKYVFEELLVWKR